jgi:hypothetical protein
VLPPEQEMEVEDLDYQQYQALTRRPVYEGDEELEVDEEE